MGRKLSVGIYVAESRDGSGNRELVFSASMAGVGTTLRVRSRAQEADSRALWLHW
jgi:hypothetical protein